MQLQYDSNLERGNAGEIMIIHLNVSRDKPMMKPTMDIHSFRYRVSCLSSHHGNYFIDLAPFEIVTENNHQL